MRQIVSTHKKIKVDSKKLEGWKRSIKLLINNDGVTPERIEKALDWYADHIDDEFVPVIESGRSLREKFVRLEDAMKRMEKQKKKNKYKFQSNYKFGKSITVEDILKEEEKIPEYMQDDYEFQEPEEI